MNATIHVVMKIAEIMESHGFPVVDVAGDEEVFYATIRPNAHQESPERYFHEAVMPHLTEYDYTIEFESEFMDKSEGMQFLVRRIHRLDD